MKYWLHIGFLIFLTGCSSGPAKLILQPTDFSELKGWQQGDHTKALSAFQKSCQSLVRRPKNFTMGAHAGTAEDWRNVCLEALRHPRDEKRFFEKNFTPFTAQNRGKADGLFTGYHVPELQGSHKRTSRFKYPVYRMPHNGKAPNQSRKNIEDGSLKDKNLETAYVDNAVDLFFMHIQGSGNIRMQDGSLLRLGYAGQNGHTYRSIGAYLIEQEIMTKEEVTAPSLKEWLHNTPKYATFVMHQNPSYIFFRTLPGPATAGPIGSQGIELTPEHSLAVDNSFIAYGTPIWLQTELPATSHSDQKPLNQLLIAQDSGGAIKGPIRGDIFFGSSKHAERLAGNMNATGKYYILLPNSVAARSRSW
jgi:membrane-bound lytic murein transglycosylase A